MIEDIWTYVLIIILLIGLCVTMNRVKNLEHEMNQLQISLDYTEVSWHEMEEIQ